MCEAGYNGNPFGYTTCTPTSLTFTFGVPQTVTISANAWAYTGPMYAADVSGGASYGGFYIYVNGEPCDGASFTLVPGEAVPEPGMFPVLAALACAGLMLHRQQRR